MRSYSLILQSIYSTKSWGDKAPFFEYSISQARADIFFSLLFGGQIVASAGAFFDAPIALRVLGELMSHPKFIATCIDYGWRPLRLNTDGDAALSPAQYLAGRWLNPTTEFTFFREPGQSLWEGETAALAALKKEASEAVDRGEFGRLSRVLKPLYANHLIRQSPAGRRDSRYLELPPASMPAVLTPAVGEWLRAILGYLRLDDTFTRMSDASRLEYMKNFSLFDAVMTRTNALTDEYFGQFSKSELCALNIDFIRKVPGRSSMNAYHIEGPSHYGHYYTLIHNWIEIEWHILRHQLYQTDTCLLSSDWTLRDLFDFDRESKVTYLSNVAVDDSLRVAQEGFAQIHWDVLLAVITDHKWATQIQRLHEHTNLDQKRRAAEEILDFLAVKLADFIFDTKDGRISILAKRASKVGALASYAGIVSKYHNTLEGLFGSGPTWSLAVGGATLVSDAPRLASPLAKVVVKGLRYASEKYEAMRLRRAIVPGNYLPMS
jgi:hypothetical protein